MGNQTSQQDRSYHSFEEIQKISEQGYYKGLINSFKYKQKLKRNEQLASVHGTNNNPFKFLNCVPNINCFDQQNFKLSQWLQQLRYLTKTEFCSSSWAKYIGKHVKSNSKLYNNKLMDDLNQKQVMRVAVHAKQQVENQNLTDQQIEEFIYQILEDTEILTEILQEYRHIKDDDSQQQCLRDKNINIYKCAYQYKAIIRCIEDQVRDVQHPLYLLREEFVHYFIEKQLDMKELKEFVSFYVEILRVYYWLDDIVINCNPSSGEMDSFINMENVSNFVVSLLFSSEKLYNHVFREIQQREGELQFNYQKNLKIVQDSGPEIFNISNELCLNERTIEHFKQQQLQQQQEKVEEGFYQEEEKCNEIGGVQLEKVKEIGEGQGQEQKEVQLELKENCIRVREEEKRFGVPYQKCLEMLQRLRNCKQPVKMLKILIAVSEQILKCIEEFYKENGLQKSENKYYCYDGDNFLSIFVYLIVQSQMEHLFVYLGLVQEFVQRNMNNSVSGYLLITLEGGIHYIAEYNSIKNRKKD